MAPKIKIPGFRPGKVPMNVVEKMYGPEVFYEEAANTLVMPQYVDAVREAVELIHSSSQLPALNLISSQVEKGKDLSLKQLWIPNRK